MNRDYYSAVSPRPFERLVMALDSVILWCFGWKRMKRRHDTCWRDPMPPHHWLTQAVAIDVLERRIEP